MDKYLKFAWFIATVTSWISFAVATWFWADDLNDQGMLTLMILWFVMSLTLFVAGLRFRKSPS